MMYDDKGFDDILDDYYPEELVIRDREHEAKLRSLHCDKLIKQLSEDLEVAKRERNRAVDMLEEIVNWGVRGADGFYEIGPSLYENAAELLGELRPLVQ